MNKALILEDSEERIKFFKEYVHMELRFARTASEAISFLRNEIFTHVFLDNDLGDGNGTGIDVAEYMRRNLNYNLMDVIIHSMNYPAARTIRGILPYAEYIPFTSLKNFMPIV